MRLLYAFITSGRSIVLIRKEKIKLGVKDFFGHWFWNLLIFMKGNLRVDILIEGIPWQKALNKAMYCFSIFIIKLIIFTMC